MKLDGRSKLVMALVAVAMTAWVLRKAKVLYIPALTAFTLAIAMGMVGVNFIAQKGASKKVAGVLILSFGLFMIVTGIFELMGILA